MPVSVWVINLVVLAVLLEADLGRRKIGWFRVVRPLGGAAYVVLTYMVVVPTSGNNVALEVAGAGVGVILGLASHLFISVRFDPTKGKAGRSVSHAGVAYGVFWVIVFGARLAFIYSSEHLFSRSLGQFLAAHQLALNGLTDALIFMALTMAVARSVLLAGRGLAARRQHTVAQLQVA
jgi:hypothetical protein